MFQPRAYLFDLDGTLIDSVHLILASYRHTLRTHRGSAPADHLWLAGLGTPLREQLRPFCRDADELEGMVETYRTYNFAHHDRLVRPFPGVRAAVSNLRDRGHRLAVVTSKARRGLDCGLRVCGLDDLFDALVSADDVEHHKPAPEPVLKALTLVESEPRDAVFVGDSPHDMAAGQAAGVATAAALWGPFSRADLQPHAPTHWLTEPTQLADFLTT